MTTLISDLQYAIRQLRKSPGFTLTAIVTLALGIGATSAIYTVVDSVVLKPLAFRNFQQLTFLEASLTTHGETATLGVNPALYRMYRQRCPAFQVMAAYRSGSLGLTAGKGMIPKQIGVLSATKDFFRVMGNAPIMGREFTANEFVPGHDQAAVISDALWRRELHSDPNILGKPILLDSKPITVIGIMPPSFRVPRELMGYSTSGTPHAAEVFMPLKLPIDSTDPTSDWNYAAVARLHAGVPATEASAQMNAVLAPAVAKIGGDIHARAAAVPLLRAIDGDATRGLWLLFGAVGCVLLIACVNLANLQLARARARGREHAIRAALGANGARLFQYSLMESMLLAFAGGIGGIFMAFAGVKFFLILAPHDLPRIDQVHVRWETVAITALLSIGTGLFFGLAPAWAALRTDPHQAMHEGGTRMAGARGSRKFGFVLIALEAAACAVLLMAALLLTRSLHRLLDRDLGFSAQHVVVAEVNLGDKHFDTPARIRFYDRLLPVLRRLPGVQSASFISSLPMQGDDWVDGLDIPGDTRPQGARPTANIRWVSPDYLRTMEIPLIGGRLLNGADRGTGNVVISQAAARAAWPNLNPLGRTFKDEGDSLTVVGVVANTRSRSLTLGDDRMVYQPYWRLTKYSAHGYLTVRAVGDPKLLTDSIQRTIWSIDPTVPIPEIRSMPGIIESSVSLEHFEMSLLVAFGIAALGLAALGIYGVLAVTVAERQRDLAVRIALGADKARVLCLVLGQGMSPVAAGLVIGLVLGVTLAKAAQSLLPDVAPYDSVSIATTIVLLLAIALCACLVPARRAAAVDPMTILRAE